uniref:Uncharacterized protein n=1 Tax=Klebsiella phage FKP3 TaxID=3231233 RepID=A0AAU8HZK4_9CAUD
MSKSSFEKVFLPAFSLELFKAPNQPPMVVLLLPQKSVRLSNSFVFPEDLCITLIERFSKADAAWKAI